MRVLLDVLQLFKRRDDLAGPPAPIGRVTEAADERRASSAQIDQRRTSSRSVWPCLAAVARRSAEGRPDAEITNSGKGGRYDLAFPPTVVVVVCAEPSPDVLQPPPPFVPSPPPPLPNQGYRLECVLPLVLVPLPATSTHIPLFTRWRQVQQK